MVVILKEKPDTAQLQNLLSWLAGQGIKVSETHGERQSILGLIGDTSIIDIDLVKALDIVEDVKRIQEPYKNANRKFHHNDATIEIDNTKIGAGHFQMIAGPCSIESPEQICSVAKSVKDAGATMLRGGAFKPRTSPYAFQGLRGDGIKLLLEAKKETGLPVVTEIMDLSQLDLFEDVDLIQVGARNMQNFELLKELSRTRKPIIIKRGLANTLQELLMSVEYIMAGGNNNVILCERGIRTFETAARNTLDISAIPLLKKMTHLPIVVDPSHATGIASLVMPLSLASTAAGADGLMIEVHNDPEHALCDGPQSLTPQAFKEVSDAVYAIRPFSHKYNEGN